jgi:exopolysaccharide production protein ExoY
MKSADIAEHAPGATLERKDVVDGFHSFDITFHSFDITKITPIGGATKRYFDVTVAMIALILLAPVFIAVTCLLMFKSKEPVLYRHKRIGFHGREFECLKFTTMLTYSEEAFQEYLQQNREAREEWNETRKLRYDPRVTPIGTFLRKTSLDELPQLINVMKGEMSLVGPRPVTRQELDHYGKFSAYYLQTRPGLTGAWQISGRSDTSYQERVALDTRYVRNWSFWADLKIMVLTVPCVVTAKGSS